MTEITRPSYKCDGPKCGKIMDKPVVTTEDVAHEGCSSIRLGNKYFEVGGQHYCSLHCLLEHIKHQLGSKR